MARNIEELINRQIHRWNSISTVLRKELPGLGENEVETRPGEVERPLYPVICISREMGAGARDIARLLSRRLNYEIFGSEIINQIANDLKVQERLIRSIDEEDRAQFQILVDSFLSGHEIEASDFLNSLTRVIEALAMKGGVVLLGRGGNFILGDRSALNVRIVAPFGERVERVQRYFNIGEEKAREMIERTDILRTRFIRHFFHADIHDNKYFDLVINTSRLPTVAATELILAALRVRGFIPEKIALPAVLKD